MSEHPPIPEDANDAAFHAWLDASHPLAADRVRSIVASVAPILWREWRRGMAVVPLPEGEIVKAALEVRKYWRDWPQQRRDGVRSLSRFVAGAIEDLCAAADRAEQLAAGQTEAVNGG